MYELNPVSLYRTIRNCVLSEMKLVENHEKVLKINFSYFTSVSINFEYLVKSIGIFIYMNI